MSSPVGSSRRQFLQQTSATAALTVVQRVMATTSIAPGVASVLELSATEAVTAITRGEITAENYAAVLLGRCAVGKALNAFITLEPDRVLEAARACDLLRRRRHAKPGPLHGLPVPIKDSVNTKDYPTTGGTAALTHFRPTEDAPIVQAIRRAGGIILGKTNLHELSYGYTSNNLRFGAVHNPYDPSCIPGGSSGGTAAAVAALMAPLGLAEDTEGSIRVPAALCGIPGFRPTTGRYSTEGVVPVSPLFDQVGPQARAVADIALFDSAVIGDWSRLVAPPLEALRLGVVRPYWYTELDPEVEHVIAAALERLKDSGVVLVESDRSALPGLSRLIELTTNPICDHDVRLELAQYLKKYGAEVTFDQVIAQSSPEIQKIMETYVLPGAPNFVTEPRYREACDVFLPTLKRLFQNYFTMTGVAAIIFPTTTIPAVPIGQVDIEINSRKIPIGDALARNVAPGSTAGLPGLVLPAGMTPKGLPVALELDAPHGADRALLALGLSVERRLGRLRSPSN
jgi:indoleacetamide hydrolase